MFFPSKSSLRLNPLKKNQNVNTWLNQNSKTTNFEAKERIETDREMKK